MRTSTLGLLAVGALSLAAASGVHASRFSLALPRYLADSQTQPGAWSNSVVVADLDGDGRDDVAFMSWEHPVDAEGISTSFQRADGSMTPPQRFVSPDAATHHLHAADVNGDGASELLVGHSGGVVVYDLRAGGRGSIQHLASPSPCRFLTSGDLDMDGALDVYCQGLNGSAALFPGRKGIGLGAPRAMEVPGFGGSDAQVVIAEATGDAWPDLVLAAWGQNAVFVLPNDGEGGFEPAVVYPMPGENVVGTPTVAVVDLDKDGANEIVAAQQDNLPNAALFVWRRGANGFMRYDHAMQSLDNPTAIIARDMDGDGHPELIVSHAGYFTVSRYLGTPAGLAPQPYFSMVRTEHSARAIATGDLDSDGQVDVVVGNIRGVAVLYGGREQTLDLDGDLVSDVVWRHASTGRHAAWAAGDARLPLDIPTFGRDWMPAAFGSFEVSPGTDVLHRHARTGSNTLWTLGQTEGQPHSQLHVSWQVGGVGDFDADGVSDVLWRSSLTGANTLWLAGDPSRVQNIPRLADQKWSVAGVGDFDGDGASDVLWRHSGSGSNIVWGGADRARQRTLPGAGLDWDVAGIGDFDRDGDDDVVWRNRRTGVNAIWRSASPATPWPIRAVADTRWQIAAVGDYNGDGYSDVLWWHSATGRNAIWLGADQQRQKPLRDLADTRWRVVR